MRSVLLAAVAVLLSAGLACAEADVTNGQGQLQGGGAIGTPNIMLGGAIGVQGQFGAGYSDLGDNASDGQSNYQSLSGGQGFGDAANHTSTGWATEQTQQAGGSSGIGGVYAYEQTQGQVGGAAMVGVGGQLGAAGSAYVGTSQSSAAALGLGATAGAGQEQRFAGAYDNMTSTPDSYVNNFGNQEAYTQTDAGVFMAGAAASQASATQYGGTAAANSGDGTAMGGVGAAHGEAEANAGAVGLADANASAGATQMHGYEQAAGSAGAYQQQSGFVSTTVQATD